MRAMLHLLLLLGAYIMAACGQSGNRDSQYDNQQGEPSTRPIAASALGLGLAPNDSDLSWAGIAMGVTSASVSDPTPERGAIDRHPVRVNEPPAELFHQAIYESDETKRLDAVTTLGLYREDSVIDVFIRSASDPQPEIRYHSVQALRYAAADGFDKDGKITAVLRQASRDPEPAVAALADNALLELEQASRNSTNTTK